MALFQASRKGFLVPVIGVLPSGVLGITAGIISYYLGSSMDDVMVNLLLGTGFTLSGFINHFATRNYILDKDGEEVWYEPAGSFMFVGVTYWTRIFFAIAIINFVVALCRMFHVSL